MRRFTAFLLVGLIGSSLASAQPEEAPLAPAVRFPSLPERAASAAGFVPAGWVAEKEVRGDLNGDGVADLLLVLRMADSKNIVSNEELGIEELDTNPQMLVVAFANPGKNDFSLAVADHQLIPRREQPNQEPAFEDAAIVQGKLRVTLNLFMTMGGWYSSKTTYTFRHQDGCFRMIGYDSEALRRNTGETESVSINYLTRKAKVTRGTLESDKTRESWQALKSSRLYCLAEIGDGLAFEAEVRPFP